MNPQLPTPALPESGWPNLPPPRLEVRRPAAPAPPGWVRKIHWRTAIGAILLAGILHVTATLTVPLIGPGTAYQKLRELLPANTMVVVPPARPANSSSPS